MAKFSLLNHAYTHMRGGFEAIVIVENGPSRRRFDCFFRAPQGAPDRTVIKGLLAHAKEQFKSEDADVPVGFPLSPNQVRFMRSA